MAEISLSTVGDTILGKASDISLTDVSSATGGGDSNHTRTKAGSGYRRVNPHASTTPDAAEPHQLSEFEGYTSNVHQAVGVGTNLNCTALGPRVATFTWNNAAESSHGTGGSGGPLCISNRIRYKAGGTGADVYDGTVTTTTIAGSLGTYQIQFTSGDDGVEVIVGVHHIFIDADTSTAEEYPTIVNQTTGHVVAGSLTNGQANATSDGIVIRVQPLNPTITNVDQWTAGSGGYEVDCDETNSSANDYFEFGNTAYAKVIVNLYGIPKNIDIGWNTTGTTPSDGSSTGVTLEENLSSTSQFDIGTLNYSVPMTTFSFWARYAGESPEGDWSNRMQFVGCGQASDPGGNGNGN